jgi:hypothetical protein
MINSALDLPKLNPLHIAYSYNKVVKHDFSKTSDGVNKPAIINFSLSISNMIQSNDYVINCKVEAINEWSSLANPTDVSEGDTFLWIGKTQQIIRHLKTNVSKLTIKNC